MMREQTRLERGGLRDREVREGEGCEISNGELKLHFCSGWIQDELERGMGLW